MQNAGKVANGYKMILTNLLTKDLESQFNEFGLTMKKQNGEMKGAFTILEELAKKYQELGTTVSEDGESTESLNDKMNKLLRDISGGHNINVLTAGFDNFKQAINATDTAINSAGSAQEEYAVAMDTVKKKLEGLIGQFQKLIVGDGGLSSFIKLILDAATALLKFANTGVGGAITKLGLLYVSLSKIKSISNSITFTNIIGGLSKLTTILGVLSVGVELAKGIYDKFNVTLEEQREKVAKLKQEYTDADEKVSSTGEELKAINQRIEEINAQEGTEITKEGELESLQSQKRELEAILSLEEKRKQNAQEELEKEVEESVNKKISYKVTENTPVGMVNSFEDGTREQAIDNYRERMEQLKITMSSLEEQMHSLSEENQENSVAYNIASDALSQQKQLYEELEDQVIEWTEQLLEETEGTENNLELREKLIDIIEDLVGKEKEEEETIDDLTKKMSKYDSELGKTNEVIKEQGKAFGKTEEEIEEYAKGLLEIKKKNPYKEVQKFGQELKDLESAFQLASDAQYEYNQQGYLSLDTYSQLMQVQPEYLAMMFDENGQLISNADATTLVAQAKAEEMGLAAARAQIDLATNLQNEGKSYAELASGAISAADGQWELVKALAAQAVASGKDAQALLTNISAIEQLTNATKANIGANIRSYQPVNQNTGATRSNTGAQKGNTGARKDNKKVIDEQTEALKRQREELKKQKELQEKELDKYEIVANYIKKLFEEERKKWEDKREEEEKYYDSIIKSKEKEYEDYETLTDRKIQLRKRDIEDFKQKENEKLEKLKSKRKEEEKYWNEEIEKAKQANEEKKESIKLEQLKENLAKAKSQKVMVLKNGKFTYEEDREAISKAEQELADYEMELETERHVRELEKQKDNALKYLDKQIAKQEEFMKKRLKLWEREIQQLEREKEDKKFVFDKEIKDLKTTRDSQLKIYDNKIKYWKEREDAFEAQLQSYEDKRAARLMRELNLERDIIYPERQRALNTFVTNYNNKKKELATTVRDIDSLTEKIDKAESNGRAKLASLEATNTKAGRLASDIGTIAANAASTVANALNSKRYKIEVFNSISGSPGIYGSNLTMAQAATEMANAVTKTYKDKQGNTRPLYSNVVVKPMAIGSYAIEEDTIGLVADPLRPSNRELIVGAKLNKGDGVLGNFKKGTGVIPHGQTLTENLVNLARWSQNGGLERIENNSSTSSKIVTIGTINLPSVENGNDFIQYLENNFLSDSIQFSHIRGI